MDKFIIKPFNAVYIIFVGAVILSVLIFAFCIRKKPLEKRRKIMIIFTTIVAVFLMFYKFSFRLDKQFIEDYPKYWGEYTIFNELPFNPCNVVLWLFPIALITKKNYLLSFCVFMGIISTAIAICIPQQGYAGYSIFCWHTFGFFLLHSLGIAISLTIIPLGLYEPKYKDIISSSLVMIVSTTFSFILSLVIVKTGLCEFANYTFTMGPEGNVLLEFLYKLIPVKGIYILPLFLIYWTFCLIVISLNKLSKKKIKK